MLAKIEAWILIFPGTDFHFPSTSVPPGTFLGFVITEICFHTGTARYNATASMK